MTKANGKKQKTTDDVAARAEDSIARAIANIEKQVKISPIDLPDGTLPHVSTGSSTIDMLIGGTLANDGKSILCPGFPRRRITEVYGPESSGKTTLALSAIAKLLKAEGSALFLDFEHHISKKYAISIGVEWDSPRFKVYQPDTFEDGFKVLQIAIGTGIDLVVVDSVAAMIPGGELEKGVDDVAKLGAVAKLMSEKLPKLGQFLDKFPKDKNNKDKKDENHPGTAIVLLNQTRALIQTQGGGRGGGDNENTSGGKSLKFYSTLRIRLSRIKSEVVKRKDKMSGREINVPYGNLTHVKIVKSKLDGTQNQTAQLFIRFNYGVDDYFSIIEAAVANKLITKSGSRFVVNGENFHGKEALRKYLIANPPAFAELKDKIRAIVIEANKGIDPQEDLGDEDDILEEMNRSVDDDKDDEDLAMGGVPEEVVESEETETEAAEAN